MTPRRADVVSRTWRVGRYTATLTVHRLATGKLVSAPTDWEPHMPKRWGRRMQAQWLAGLALFCAACNARWRP